MTDDAGSPVSGAKVIVWTAAVKTGYSTMCPSCYPDCGKSATTAPDGTFTIPSVDPDLKYQLMFVHESFAHKTKGKIDPLAPAQTIALERKPPLPADPAQSLRGRVLDLNGNPIAHAMVQPRMIYWKEPNGKPGGAGGQVKGMDAIAMTDRNGEFVVSYAKLPVTKWELEISARGYAGQYFKEIDQTKAATRLRLGPGATVRGRLLRAGAGVSGVQMLLTHGDRGMEFLGTEKIGTDSEGYFTFVNVPIVDMTPAPEYLGLEKLLGPRNRWWLAASIASLKGNGATKPTPVLVERHDQDIDLGDIEIGPALHIRGRVVTADGKPIPEGSTLSVNPQTSWEPIQRKINPDGTFFIDGLFADDWDINFAIKGYGISRFQPCRQMGIAGALTQSLDDYVVLVDTDSPQQNHGVAGPYPPLQSIDPKHLPQNPGK
ncbi:MAG: carboxypeptidase-like regulatory domain-containing protein [Phycisphaerales bacterium]|nr:carboxypeptidase-like regulatory domain-containing protein [Phycisphaerales bacterium]